MKNKNIEKFQFKSDENLIDMIIIADMKLLEKLSILAIDNLTIVLNKLELQLK